MSVPLGVKICSNLPEICHMEIGVRPGAMILERVQVRTNTPTRTFSHDAAVLQVRLTTAQKLVVRHLKCHGLGPQIANRLVTGLHQHLMGRPLLGGALAAGCRVAEQAHQLQSKLCSSQGLHPLCIKERIGIFLCLTVCQVFSVV